MFNVYNIQADIKKDIEMFFKNLNMLVFHFFFLGNNWIQFSSSGLSSFLIAALHLT